MKIKYTIFFYHKNMLSLEYLKELNQDSTEKNYITDWNKDLHKLNIVQIEKVLREYTPIIWAAWGTTIEKRSYLWRCLTDIIEVSRKYNCSWISFGKVSKNGHPHHPLFLSRLVTPDEFLVKSYIERKLLK